MNWNQSEEEVAVNGKQLWQCVWWATVSTEVLFVLGQPGLCKIHCQGWAVDRRWTAKHHRWARQGWHTIVLSAVTHLYEVDVQVHEEWHSGRFLIKATDEDVHTANERRLKVVHWAYPAIDCVDSSGDGTGANRSCCWQAAHRKK